MESSERQQISKMASLDNQTLPVCKYAQLILHRAETPTCSGLARS